MYYSSAQESHTLQQQALAAPVRPPKPRRGRKWWWLGVMAVGLLVPLVASRGQVASRPRPTSPSSSTAAVVATPQVAGVSFGDLLKKQPSFQGWLAGVDEGNIVLLQPDSGAVLPITSVDSRWKGPISAPVWSPDRSKLAYLLIPPESAASLVKDPEGFARANGLAAVPTPGSFPFGQLAVVDLTSKQVTRSTVEVRNTPRTVVWLDDQTLATVGQALVTYNVADGSTKTLAAAGNSGPTELLQSPLVWHAGSHTLYYTKVNKGEQQSVRLAMSLELSTGKVQELGALRTGSFEDVTSPAGIDLSLSDDGQRLAILAQDGLSYRTLQDGGMHPLPYKEEWIWLRDSTLAQLQWLSPAKLAFVSMSREGSRVWGVWDIPSSQLYTFGKDAVGGSWNVAAMQLALLQPDGRNLGILTPNWDDQAASILKSQPLAWEMVSW